MNLDAATAQYIEHRRALTEQLLQTLIRALDLQLTPEEIGMDSPLFGAGLGLDSLDAVAIAAAVETEFPGVEVKDSDIQAFRSVNAIVDFVMQKQGLLAMPEDAPAEAGTGDLAADYAAIRNDLGLVDYSDDVSIRVAGPDHEKFIDGVAAGNLADLAVGEILQTVVLDDAGQIESMVWIAREDDGYLLLTRGNRLRRTLTSLSSGFDVSVNDVSAEHRILSIVGPHAQDFIVGFFDEDLLRLGYGEFMSYPWKDGRVIVARFGETGEFDYRIVLPARFHDDFAAAFGQLRACDRRVLDTICLEMKSIRQETAAIEPFFPSELDVPWMVWTQKESFRGRDAVIASMKNCRRLAVVLAGDAPVDAGSPIRLAGEIVGSVLVTGYSFPLAQFLALAMVVREYAWPNVRFTSDAGEMLSRTAPLFLTKTILESLSV